MDASARFLAMMFATFFERVRPDSSMAKPACIKNTRTPAMNTHRLSMTACTISADMESSCAPTGPAKRKKPPTAPAAAISSLRFMVVLPTIWLMSGKLGIACCTVVTEPCPLDAQHGSALLPRCFGNVAG